MIYELANAFALRNFWLTPPRNIFWYRNEVAAWLASAERTVALLLRLKVALDSALRDEATVRERCLGRADRLGQMMLSDTLDAIYGARGQKQLISEAMKAAHAQELQGEAKGAIKDVAIMSIPYKGLVRRALKLWHNVEVVDALLDTRLYVPVGQIKDNIAELVFKGTWTPDMNALVGRIHKAFVLDRLWSQRGAAKRDEWARVIAEARRVGDEQGRVFLQVVEQSLQYAGGVAA